MSEKEQLDTISDMCHQALTDKNISVKTQMLLMHIIQVAGGPDYTENVPEFKEVKSEHTIISCDASITKNPGGIAAVGVVIETPQTYMKIAQGSSATTSPQAEYDAIYFALEALSTLTVVDPIEIRSDCQVVIQQLKGEMNCNDPQLQRRRDLILERTKNLNVKFVWRPRNSTEGLRDANFAAQDYLKVRRH